jgi:hypothetical protein
MLAERGGHLYSEAAVALIASLAGAIPAHHVIDVQNQGALDFLSDHSVIETSCFVERGGFVRDPVQVRPNAVLTSLLSSVKAYETLTVQAALTGERKTALQALSCNPITGRSGQGRPVSGRNAASESPAAPTLFPGRPRTIIIKLFPPQAAMLWKKSRNDQRMEQKPVYLAVDGGNSKTEYRLLDAQGAVIAAHRAGGTNHENLPGGVDEAAALLLDNCGDMLGAQGTRFRTWRTRSSDSPAQTMTNRFPPSRRGCKRGV